MHNTIDWLFVNYHLDGLKVDACLTSKNWHARWDVSYKINLLSGNLGRIKGQFYFLHPSTFCVSAMNYNDTHLTVIPILYLFRSVNCNLYKLFIYCVFESLQEHDKYRCEDCQVGFSTKKVAERHARMGHVVNGLSQQQCAVCGQIFCSRGLLRSHVAVHHSGKTLCSDIVSHLSQQQCSDIIL